MDDFCTFVFDRSFVTLFWRFNEESDKLDISEIYSHHNSYEVQTRQIPNVDVGAWLTKDFPYETKPPALLRLVWIPLHQEISPWQFQIRKSSLDRILQDFEIEEAYKYSFTSPGSFLNIPVCREDDSDTLKFSMCMRDVFAVAWKYDTRSGRTESICWADDWALEAMRDAMSHQKGWAQHPLFLALVASVMLGYLLDRDTVRMVQNIAAVENRTGYHGFKHSTVTVFPGATGDYASMSATMSGCAVTLAGMDRIQKVLNEFLGDISSYSQRCRVNDDSSLGGINLEVDKCVETLKRRLKMHKIQIDYLTRRDEVQLTALFNLIAQKEAKVSIAVAQDSRTLASASKEDSTAMKTLAAVTVAYLPGTFVAGIFAMPLFEWNAVGDEIISKRFWVYWAVSIPLTCLTLFIWLLWTKRQAIMHRISEKRAKEELSNDIGIESGSGVKEKEV